MQAQSTKRHPKHCAWDAAFYHFLKRCMVIERTARIRVHWKMVRLPFACCRGIRRFEKGRKSAAIAAGKPGCFYCAEIRNRCKMVATCARVAKPPGARV